MHVRCSEAAQRRQWRQRTRRNHIRAELIVSACFSIRSAATLACTRGFAYGCPEERRLFPVRLDQSEPAIGVAFECDRDYQSRKAGPAAKIHPLTEIRCAVDAAAGCRGCGDPIGCPTPFGLPGCGRSATPARVRRSGKHLARAVSDANRVRSYPRVIRRHLARPTGAASRNPGAESTRLGVIPSMRPPARGWRGARPQAFCRTSFESPPTCR
jgi:hypothetical protein